VLTHPLCVAKSKATLSPICPAARFFCATETVLRSSIPNTQHSNSKSVCERCRATQRHERWQLLPCAFTILVILIPQKQETGGANDVKQCIGIYHYQATCINADIMAAGAGFTPFNVGALKQKYDPSYDPTSFIPVPSSNNSRAKLSQL
jgi:hypothetical protein